MDELERLAGERYREFSEAELRLLRAAPTGSAVFCGPSQTNDDPNNNPKNAESWGKSRQIRADLVRWLCVDLNARKLVDPNGIQVHAAKITGALKLSHCTVPFPIDLERCHFSHPIDVMYSHLKFLALSGSWLVGQNGLALNADGADSEGGVFLRDGFTANGQVRLLGATIGGNLDCTGAMLDNQRGIALNADGIKVDGFVFLQDGFRAKGEVQLPGATVGAGLSCEGATLENPGGHALILDSANIAGGVFLRKGFRTNGEVRMLGATIRLNLECSGARLENRGGFALNAEGVKVEGRVFLKDGFRSEGIVWLVGANIGGELSCVRACLENPNGDALCADGARIGGNVSLLDGFSAKGQVTLAGIFINGNLQCNGATLENPNGKALCADGARIEGGVLLRDGFSAKGEVDLTNATVGKYVDLRDGKFESLRLRGVNVSLLADDESCWPEPNRLQLDGFIYHDIEGPTDAKTRLRWLRLQPEFRSQPYQQLAKVLRDSGKEVQARKVLVGMEKDRRARGGIGPWQSVASWVYGFTVGYGYRPAQAFFRFAPLLVIIGWFIFHEAGRASLMYYTKADSAKGQTFNSFIYSVENSIPVLNFYQKDSWLPVGHGACTVFGDQLARCGAYVQRWFWSQIALGWVLTTLLVAGLTGIVRRE